MCSFAGFLILAAAIGGFDVIYFHIYRFRLFGRIASRWETVAHLAQSGTFIGICLCASVASRRPSVILLLFAFHFASVGADALLERGSRSGVGGLPPLEYLVHVAGATATGAALAAFLIAPPASLWPAYRALLVAMVLMGSVVSGTELVMFLRALLASHGEGGTQRGDGAIVRQGKIRTLAVTRHGG